MEISGTATDNTEITSLEIVFDGKVNTNIISELQDYGTWSYHWDTKSISSSDGEHTIEIKAMDGSDNIASDKINIIIDGKAPKASITVPEEDQIFKTGDPILVQGTASDEHGLGKVQLLLEGNTPVDITRKVVNGNWRYDYWNTKKLDSGMHTFRVSVTDSVGHNSMASVTFFIDSEEPIVEISEMEEPVVLGESIVIRGTAYDDMGIREISLAIDYEEPVDITATLVNGKWEYHLDTTEISEGKHTITVIAKDHVDNEVSYNIKLKFIQATSSQDELEDDTLGSGDDEKGIFDNLEGIFIFFIIVFVLILLVLVAFYVSGKKGN